MDDERYQRAVLAVWPHCERFLRPAIEMMHGLHDSGTVLEAILDRRAELWPGKAAAVVTEFIEYPKGRTLHFWLAGGDLDELREQEQQIAAWAADRGCSDVTISGRRGWVRALDGYSETATVMRRALT